MLPRQIPEQKFLILLSVLVLFLLFAFVGFYSLTPSRQIISEEPVVTPTPVSSLTTATPTPDLTADWQVYTSRQYGYSIKYPLDWRLDETYPEPPDSIVKIYSTRWKHNFPWGMSLNITVDSSEPAREEPHTFDNEIEEVVFAGHDCLKVTTRLPKTGRFGPRTICLKNNLVYQVQTFSYFPSAQEKELVEVSILTFRFLR